VARESRLVVAIALGAALAGASCRSETHEATTLARRPLVGTVVFFGDSITRGMGLPEEQAFPALIEKRLAADGHSLRCINAGVSGETTAQGLERVGQYLAPPPLLAVVELGANDVFRGVDRRRSHANLVAIIEAFRSVGATVVLAGTSFPMFPPPLNVGMQRTYDAVARETGVTLLPDLMNGVAGVPELNLPDGIHPNAAGQARLAENVFPLIQRLINER
jgi:acyl-CoA thioesterase-1